MSRIDRINGLVGSIAVKAPCKVTTTEAITLSGAQTISGIALTADTSPRQRVLVKDQASAIENGIYDVNSGEWTRSPDFDGARDAVDGTEVPVNEGTPPFIKSYYLSATNPVVIGTTPLTFTGRTLIDADLGTAAAKDFGANAGQVPLNSYLGTAANEDTGVDIDDVVQLEDVGGSAGLPAVDGSQLTVDSVSLSVLTGRNVKVGSGLIWFLDTAPDGYLECNGASLLRVGTYADLFAVIGTIYGAVDSIHFNVPDLRGFFTRGWDHGAGIDPDAGTRTASTATGATMSAGDHVGTEQEDDNKAHVHTQVGAPLSQSIGYHALGTASNAGTTDTGSSGGTEARPININIMYCIKY